MAHGHGRGDDESAALLTDTSVKKDYDQPLRSKFVDMFTFERIKILVLLLVMLTAAVVFSIKKEEHSVGHNLAAVAAGHNFTEDFTLSRPVVEVLLSVQQTTSEHGWDPDAPPHVYVTIQGARGASSPWVSLQTWAVEADPTHELLEKVHDFFFDDNSRYSSYHHWRFNIGTDSEDPIGITFHYRTIWTIVRYQVLLAALVLAFVYVLIVFELMHRTIAALIGSFVCIGVLCIVHARPTFFEVISWIDFETVGLLFGMMVMVGIFSNTGFFEYSAVKAYKLSRGNLWYLTVILCLFTAVVSAFLDNVTTILLLTPVTIRLCRVLDVAPEALLIAEVMFSNIGGTATPIGDPPNIIIVNDPRVAAHDDINFGTFTLHVAPGIILVGIAIFGYLYFLFRRNIKRQPHHGKMKEIDLWKRTAARINPTGGEEESRMREQLEAYVRQLQEDLAAAPEDDTVKAVDIADLEQKYQIHDRPLFISSTIVLVGVVIMFFLHSWIEEQVELSLAWIAIIGCMIHLVVSGIRDVEEVLEKVELGTLLFFAGLFVLMKGLEELGLIDFVGDQVAAMVGNVPAGKTRLLVAILLIIWVSAIVSAFIDNIPYTTAMVPVVVNLSDQLNLPLSPLIWALSYGTCLGGNGTLIGASANVVACGLAEQQGYPISFNLFFRTGFPIMLISVFVATVYIVITHVLIEWY